MQSGYYGADYDRHADRLDDSALGKVKQQFWTAKQTIISKLGKREDPSLVASDAELDAKLQVYHSVKQTCESLLKCIERYQDYICELSQEENALGRFLKNKGKSDKTQAGKIMAAVGRAQGYTAQQRLSLRVPLVRLYQELEVFTERAVVDCQGTVEAMEEARTKYRGSLLWMKDVSEQLNPDTYKQLEKFRKVQAQVRRNKSKFDKLKLDCLQKIDLLSASRCNLFSQILANYQTCLMTFWDKTAKAHNVIADSFKGYQYYEFTILKDLTQTSRKLADSTSTDENNQIEKDEKTFDEGAELITLGVDDKPKDLLIRSDSLENLFKDSPETERSSREFDNVKDELASILSLNPTNSNKRSATTNDKNVPATDNKSEFQMLDFLEETELTSNDGAFAQQWEDAFGIGSVFDSKPTTTPSLVNENNVQQTKSTAKSLLPSELMDLQLSDWSLPPAPPFAASQKGLLLPNEANSALLQQQMASTKLQTTKMGDSFKKPTQKDVDKSAWFNLFADVDPLQNPDSLGKAPGSSDDGC